MFSKNEETNVIKANVAKEKQPAANTLVSRTTEIIGDIHFSGELIVEGEKHDIRYKAMQFDGWKQRHWTVPFEGERYSLVWFTPKECEGMRGIDLDLK